MQGEKTVFMLLCNHWTQMKKIFIFPLLTTLPELGYVVGTFPVNSQSYHKDQTQINKQMGGSLN